MVNAVHMGMVHWLVSYEDNPISALSCEAHETNFVTTFPSHRLPTFLSISPMMGSHFTADKRGGQIEAVVESGCQVV